MKNNRSILLAGLALGLAALAAYHNSFGVPFVFDDEPSILQNPSITRLWPLSVPLSPPSGFGFTVSGRPVLNLSLALNHAISGTDVWSYHVGNLLIHVLAGLTLFGLVRRTLELSPCGSELAREDRNREQARSHKYRPESPASRLLPADARPVAFTIALLWTLHPLQTEAVTYTIQRAESLMGLFYLLAVYGLVRSVDSPRPHFWRAWSIGACLLGTGCKEVIVTAPVVILLYDRTFIAGSFRAAGRQRWGYYAGLMLTWLPLAWLVANTGGNRGGTFVFTTEACGSYWLTQFEAVTRYVQLALWPTPLVFDYGFFKAGQLSSLAPYAGFVLVLLGATLWALAKRPVPGFLGACFFLILAPTSLVPGITQVIVEHRMYLSLAAVMALVVGGATAWWGRRGLVLLLGLALVAGWLTERRNADYASDLRLWRDAVAKRPNSALAQSGLGVAYHKLGNYPEAVRHLEISARLSPAVARTHYNLGLALGKSDRLEEAAAQFAEAVRLVPVFAAAQTELAGVMIKQGRPAEVVGHLQAALGIAPYSVEANASLGEALAGLGEMPPAIAAYERALRVRPDLADVHFNLGLALAASGRTPEARAQYAEAVRLMPTHAEARLNLGILLAQTGRGDEALGQLREAARLKPGLAEAQANLGIALVAAGRMTEAVTRYEEALRLRPDYALAHYNLGNALVQLQRWGEAKRHFAEAVRLAPDFGAAREMLARLQAMPAGP